jgi:hypothetical protein
MSELPDLNNLEFENLEMSRGEKHEVDNSKNDTDEDKILIDYSSSVVATLKDLMKSHNQECENKVSLKELKEVFRNGANCLQAKAEKIPCGVLALARVNMFLRLKSGEIMEVSRSQINSLDISDFWYPSESDFAKASELAEANNLNYEFKNINNLYLEEYTKIELEY